MDTHSQSRELSVATQVGPRKLNRSNRSSVYDSKRTSYYADPLNSDSFDSEKT